MYLSQREAIRSAHGSFSSDRIRPERSNRILNRWKFDSVEQTRNCGARRRRKNLLKKNFF